MANKSIRWTWAKTCEEIGKPGAHFHDSRRVGVRNLDRAGVSEVVAMKISGHKTRSVFDRYNIVNEEDLQDAAKKLGAYNSEASSHS